MIGHPRSPRNVVILRGRPCLGMRLRSTLNTGPPLNPEFAQAEDTSPPRVPLPTRTKGDLPPKALVSKPAERPTPFIHASPWIKMHTPSVVQIAIDIPQPQSVELPHREFWAGSPATPWSGPAMAENGGPAGSDGGTWRNSNGIRSPLGPHGCGLYCPDTRQLESVRKSRNKDRRFKADVTIDRCLIYNAALAPLVLNHDA